MYSDTHAYQGQLPVRLFGARHQQIRGAVTRDTVAPQLIGKRRKEVCDVAPEHLAQVLERINGYVLLSCLHTTHRILGKPVSCYELPKGSLSSFFPDESCQSLAQPSHM